MATIVNVDAAGYSTKDLTGTANKNSLLFFLKQNGWGVYSLSVSKSRPEDQYFHITVRINAAANTSAELEKIKSGVGAVLRTVLPLSSLQASFSGAAAQVRLRTVQPSDQILNSNVSAFTFQITGIGSEPLKAKHDNFNAAFRQQFPKLLYTNPSSSYTNAGFAGLSFAGGQSQIHAVGETALSPDATKAIIVQLLRNAGVTISSNINFDQYTISQIQAGAVLKTPTYTTTAGNKSTNYYIPGTSVEIPSLGLPPIPDLGTGNILESVGKLLGLDKLASSLGLVAGTATVTALLVGGVFVVIMLKK